MKLISNKYFILVLVLSVLSVGVLLLYRHSAPRKTVPNTPINPSVSSTFNYEPIECNGNQEEEFKKRRDASSHYREPEIYTGIYENKWDRSLLKQNFNVLDKTTKPVSPLPVRSFTSGSKFPVSKLPWYFTQNYIEKISYRASEIQLEGSGYYFLPNNEVLTLISNFTFFEPTERRNDSCFDDGKRSVILTFDKYKNYYITPEIQFSKFSPQYCAVYASSDDNTDYFLVCLAEKLSQSEVRVLIFAYTLTDVIADTTYTNTKQANLILQDSFTTYNSDNFYDTSIANLVDIVENKQGEYYLFSTSNVYLIKKDESGFLRLDVIAPPAQLGNIQISYPPYAQIRSQLGYVILDNFSGDYTKFGAVLDAKNHKFLNIDYSSCIKPSPDDFYNMTIDPFRAGPYKNLQYFVLSPNHLQIEQSSANAGCVTDEGIINVYFNDSEVTCNIEVIGKQNCD